MPIKFELIKAGDVLYDCHKVTMGNTRIKRMGTWTVKIIEIMPERRGAMASWNGNRAEFYSVRRLERLRRTPVVEKKSPW